VRFVDNQRLVLAEIAVVAGFGQENAVGHELERGVFYGAVVKTDLIADFMAEFTVELLRGATRHRRRGEASRLGAADPPGAAEAEVEGDLGELGGLAAAGVPGDDDDLMILPRLLDFFDVAGDRQLLRIRDPEFFTGGNQFRAGLRTLHASARRLFGRKSHSSSRIRSPIPA